MVKIAKKGFISIEVVITAAIVLAVGLGGIMTLGGNGASTMNKAMNRLEATGTFGGPVAVASEYDDYGYARVLNINPSDINAEADFTYAWNADLDGWTITGYLNDADSTVVIPQKLADGELVVQLGFNSFSSKPVTSVAIPNGVLSIRGNTFLGTQVSEFVIPGSVNEVLTAALASSSLTSARFMGPLPTVSGSGYVFHPDYLPAGEGWVLVPNVYLADYQASIINVDPSAYAGY